MHVTTLWAKRPSIFLQIAVTVYLFDVSELENAISRRDLGDLLFRGNTHTHSEDKSSSWAFTKYLLHVRHSEKRFIWQPLSSHNNPIREGILLPLPDPPNFMYKKPSEARLSRMTLLRKRGTDIQVQFHSHKDLCPTAAGLAHSEW